MRQVQVALKLAVLLRSRTICRRLILGYHLRRLREGRSEIIVSNCHTGLIGLTAGTSGLGSLWPFRMVITVLPQIRLILVLILVLIVKWGLPRLGQP